MTLNNFLAVFGFCIGSSLVVLANVLLRYGFTFDLAIGLFTGLTIGTSATAALYLYVLTRRYR